MKVLLVGSGGREDALAWALLRSKRLTALRCAPGNGGMARRTECVPIAADEIDRLAEHAQSERYDLVIVGPEGPLVSGLGDRLRSLGIPVFGPSAAAAMIEGSKIFAKRFMERHHIPTAAFRVFERVDEAVRFLESSEARYPLVVKADGLAAGKGVVLAEEASKAIEAARSMLVEGRFGKAGARILVEEQLTGREASFFVLTDGRRIVELATCQDYKRALDGDRGPNTGGMGTYSPSVYLDEPMRAAILETVIRPTIEGLASEERPYRGVLYAGLMLTDDGPKVLEFNARFGDPETQVLIPRLDGDWLALLAGAAGAYDFSQVDPQLSWKENAAVCVVMSAAGYPGRYDRGRVIRGIDDAERMDGVEVFHAGTAAEGNALLTAGGRVLGVAALGQSLADARETAYAAVETIHWDGEHHRMDIAADAVQQLEVD